MGTSLNHLYELNKNDTVELSVMIGHAQQGDSTLYLKGKKLIEYDSEDFNFVVPGSGEDLHLQELVCITIVKDINKQVNKTSIEYRLSGGKDTYNKILQETVDKDGGVLIYNAVFQFYTYGMGGS